LGVYAFENDGPKSESVACLDNSRARLHRTTCICRKIILDNGCW
jgi:hypothetical protein